MNRKTPLWLALVATCPTPTPAREPATSLDTCAVRPRERPIFDSAQRARIDALMRDMVTKQIAPGAVVMVEQRGRIVYSASYGQADAETKVPMRDDALFRIYSMTKPVTSVAVMQLVERGKLSLDTPVARFIPEFGKATVWTGAKGNPPETEPLKRPITIRDLLTHSAGLTYASSADNPIHRLYLTRGIPAGPGVAPPPKDGSAPIATAAVLASRIAPIPLMNQPGTRMTYGNATDVLGRVVEVVSGQRLSAYIERNILRPLGMTSTTFHLAPGAARRLTSAYTTATQIPSTSDNVLGAADPAALKAIKPFRIDAGATSIFLKPEPLEYGGAGLVGSTKDYLRFTRMLREGGRIGRMRILSRRSVDLMRADQLTPEARAASTMLGGLGFGYGFALRLAPTSAHPVFPQCGYFWGGAASTFFWVDPVGETSGVVMTQMFGGDVRSYYMAMLRTLYDRPRQR